MALPRRSGRKRVLRADRPYSAGGRRIGVHRKKREDLQRQPCERDEAHAPARLSRPLFRIHPHITYSGCDVSHAILSRCRRPPTVASRRATGERRRNLPRRPVLAAEGQALAQSDEQPWPPIVAASEPAEGSALWACLEGAGRRARRCRRKWLMSVSTSGRRASALALLHETLSRDAGFSNSEASERSGAPARAACCPKVSSCPRFRVRRWSPRDWNSAPPSADSRR